MTYAVVATGGKQYKVELGRTYRVELLAPTDKVVVLDQVLLYVEGDNVQVGTPLVQGVTVTAEVVEAVSPSSKLTIFKYKAKSRYRKTRGHRQKHTLIKVTAIGSKTLSAPAKSPKPAKPAKPANKAKKVTKPRAKKATAK